VLFDAETGAPRADGKARMEAILQAAKPLLDERLELAIHRSRDGSEARTQAIKQIAGWLAQYTDPVGREVRIDAVLGRMNISRELLEQAMGSVQGRGRGAPPIPSRVVSSPPAVNRPSGARPVTAPAMPRPSRAGPPKQTFRVSSRVSPAEKMILSGL